MTPVATTHSPAVKCELRPPATPKLSIAGAPAETALLIACARRPTFPLHANTLTPGADAILASALSPVMTINKAPLNTCPTPRPAGGAGRGRSCDIRPLYSANEETDSVCFPGI